MKIIKKLFNLAVVLLFTVSLLSLASIVYAQDITGDSTVSPTSSNLNSVTIVSNTTAVSNASLLNSDAWAVGDGGVIIRWDGTRWSTVASNTSVNLNSVVMTTSDSGWAVGGANSNPIILRYNGTWSIWNTTGFNSTLYGVTTDSVGSSGWAVGSNGTVVFWNVTRWDPQCVSSQTLRAVAMVHDAHDAWAVGDGGTILYFNGKAWVNVSSPTTSPLYSIVMVNASEGWAVGGEPDGGVILYWNGTVWRNWDRINLSTIVNSTTGYVTDKINSTLTSVAMDTANSAWAVGADGTVVYWTGTEWVAHTGIFASSNLRGVAMVHGASEGSSYAWAVGNGGRILAWTGTIWVPEFPVAVIPVILGFVALAAFIGKSRFSKKMRL